jgi:hypothetical protein
MKMKKLLIACAGLVLLGSAGSAGAVTLYAENFNDNVADGFGATATIETAPSTEKFLGVLDLGRTETVDVTTTGYNGLVLAFDLYAIRSLDGNGTTFCCGPDPFRVIVNGVSTVFDFTFTNIEGWTQSYGGPNSPGRTGSNTALYGNLGYGDHFGTNSVYHISLALGSGVTSIGFQGATEQGWNDEGYGIDNILLTGNAVRGPVPEPATWAMMILGFGATGAMVRRRRTLAAA